MKSIRWIKPITASACIAAMLNISACGTVLYPERKGQINGRLDAAVIALDAIGLLFFFVPGVVAFAVDFSNGTIYLPDGKTSLLSREQLKQLAEEGKVNVEAVEQAVRKRLSLKSSFKLDQNHATRVHSSVELDALFRQTQTRTQLARL